MSSPVIRRFRPSDFSQVVSIEREVFSEHDPVLYVDFYESNPEGFFVADINGRVAGYAVCFITKSGMPAPQTLEEEVELSRARSHGHSGQVKGKLFTLAVAPSWQGRGIGSRLLGEVIRFFHLRGVFRICLEVRASNLRAQRLYSRFGFTIVGVKPGYYPDGENALLMERKFNLVA